MICNTLQQQAMCSDLVCVCVSQLEDGHSLFDYDVGLNDIIQLMIRPLPDSAHSAPPPDNETTNGEASSQEDMETVRTKCCSSVVTGLTSFSCFCVDY